MDDRSEYVKIESIIDELSEFIEAAPDRIRAYYSEDHQPPKKYPLLDTSPAQLLVEDAADLVRYEIKLSEQRDVIVFDGDWSERRSYYINIGVAVELLLNAHFMKNHPMDCADRLEGNNSLNIKDGKKQFFGDIGLSLTDEQRKRISDVTELLRIKRNNSVHTGFHSMDHIGVAAPIYEVIRFLFSHISEDNLEVTAQLESVASNI